MYKIADVINANKLYNQFTRLNIKLEEMNARYDFMKENFQ